MTLTDIRDNVVENIKSDSKVQKFYTNSGNVQRNVNYHSGIPKFK